MSWAVPKILDLISFFLARKSHRSIEPPRRSGRECQIGGVFCRTLRQHHARPVLDELKAWIEATLSTLPQKQRLAEAMRYALSRWAALSVYIDDGRVEIDNNIAERAMRPLGIGRKNWLFAGSNKGGERIANILTIIETVKLQGHIRRSI